jgi:hypothetical protein
VINTVESEPRAARDSLRDPARGAAARPAVLHDGGGARAAAERDPRPAAESIGVRSLQEIHAPGRVDGRRS